MRSGWIGMAAVLLALAVIGPGCLSLDPDSREAFTRDTACPPGWYTNVPLSDDYIYAVGYSGPTYKPSKARQQALTRAISMLASTASTFIKNQMVIREDVNRVTYSDALTETEVTGKISKFVIVAEHRCFEGDDHKHKAGTSFILIRIPKEDLEIR